MVVHSKLYVPTLANERFRCIGCLCGTPACQAEMDLLLGPKATGFLSETAFEEHEGLCREGGLCVFDAMATMGRRSEIVRVRALLLEELDDAKTRCGYMRIFRVGWVVVVVVVERAQMYCNRCYSVAKYSKFLMLAIAIHLSYIFFMFVIPLFI